MKLDKSFAEILKQKLTIGSTRSILLNAIPGKLAVRLALSDLDQVDKEMATNLLNLLITKRNFVHKFSIDITGKEDTEIKQLLKIQKRLNAIQYEHDDYLKEHGVETFGIGFPLIVRRNPREPKKYIVSPIFIFPLTIKQTFDKVRHWVISRDEDSEIRLNEVLESYLENEEHIKLPEIPEEMLEDGILDKNEIESFCNILLQRLNAGFLSSESDRQSCEAIPDKPQLTDEYLKSTKVLWNGVFGLYKSQKQSQIAEMKSLLENFSDLQFKETEFEWESTFSPEQADPSQNMAVRALSAHQNLVIQGPPGTGKSQTLTAIISSALAHNKKILVVCEKRTALEVLKSNLDELVPDITKCIALIEDVVRDRTGIVQTVRNRTARHIHDSHLRFIIQHDMNKFELKSTQLENQYEALREPIWRNYKWKDVVSQWLASNKTNDDLNFLYSLQQIFRKHRTIDIEYEHLISAVTDAAIIFERLKSDLGYFENMLITPEILPKNFDRDMVFALKDVLSRIDNIGGQISTLMRNYSDLMNLESDQLLKSCEEDIATLDSLIKNWHLLGVDILAPNRMARVKSLFFRKYKSLKGDSETAKKIAEKLCGVWDTYFAAKFNVDKIESNLSFLQSQAAHILDGKHKSELNKPLSAMPLSGSNKVLRDTITESLAEIVSVVKTYTHPKENIVPTSSSYLPDLVEFLKSILKSENKIRDYYIWKNFERSMSQLERDWVKTLLTRSPIDWTILTNQAWLYYKLLSNDETDRFPTDSTSLEALKILRLSIQGQQKEIIKYNLDKWFISGQKRLKDRGLTINQVFNLRGSKGEKRNSLRKIMHMSLEGFTDFFPVVMLNPGTCSSVLPLRKSSFDIVIFDEASQLRIEDTFPAMLRGKQVIVSGDSQQMPPSSYFESSSLTIEDEANIEDDIASEEEDTPTTEEKLSSEMLTDASRELAKSESLLQFAIDSDFRQTYLDMHYRSRHPDLIMFSNVCFYNSRLVPMPEREEGTPIKFIRVDGIYDNRQNIEEAKEVVRLLKEEIDESLSVGVATFNLNQRNLILDFINDERTADASFNNKIAKLDSNGFFVKNLENIQGDERDIIIISTTFGVKKDNSFRMGFGPISQKNGYRLLNVIVTRAKQRVFVLTSIPEARIIEFRQRLDATRKIDGSIGLMAYLAYAEAVSTNNTEEKSDILEFIRLKNSLGVNQVEQGITDLTESPFEEEVVSWLSEVIDPNRIKLQYKCGGFRIDIVVLPNDGNTSKKLAIECDGAAYHSDEIAWHHDIYRQEQLETYGFVFHRIWSTNWWRNPEEEFSKLLRTIESMN